MVKKKNVLIYRLRKGKCSDILSIIIILCGYIFYLHRDCLYDCRVYSELKEITDWTLQYCVL